jgi:hypothetical protein
MGNGPEGLIRKVDEEEVMVQTRASDGRGRQTYAPSLLTLYKDHISKKVGLITLIQKNETHLYLYFNIETNNSRAEVKLSLFSINYANTTP